MELPALLRTVKIELWFRCFAAGIAYDPKENPAPKAKKDKLEVAKAEILKAIQDILNDGKKD